MLAVSQQAPCLANNNSSMAFFDSGCSLLSRQFDRDRDRVLQRGAQEGVRGLIVWSSDVEKQEAVLDICKQNRGHCYALAGIVPDNISRTNKKQHSSWTTNVELCARQSECVGLLSGLNLGKT